VDCLVEQPLATVTNDNQYVSREQHYIDLAVLEATSVDREMNNSDRQSMMKQKYLKMSCIDIVDIFQPDDELVFIRGVAGIGKSTMIDLYTLKWAKNLLHDKVDFDFVFTFTCREINTYSNIKTLQELFADRYPEIFSCIALDDLKHLSSRVLIIVDGLDELQNIYQMEKRKDNFSSYCNLQIVFNLIENKEKQLKNHKSIAVGRPKACEFLRSLLIRNHKTKVIEVCGFNESNVNKYIHNFFRNHQHTPHQSKVKAITDAIEQSNDLRVMASVPVFLWVICNVYNEETSFTMSLNSNTELYMYACLVFLKKHLQGTTMTHAYGTLGDLLRDENVLEVIHSLMVLSVKTYMNNQVLFTDKEINAFKCPVHLEQTGFIIKYSGGNVNTTIYQFRHLIMQEFFCGLYLCISKYLTPYMTNRELSSCMPTVLGIRRLLRERDNQLFMEFYESLSEYDRKTASLWTRLATPFRTWTYIKYFESFQRIPQDVIKGEKLVINSSPKCSEFMAFAYEGKCQFDDAEISEIEISGLHTKADLRNTAYLVRTLKLPVTSFTMKIPEGITHDVINLIKVITDEVNLQTEIVLGDDEGKQIYESQFKCTRRSLFIYLNLQTTPWMSAREDDFKELINLPIDIKKRSKSFLIRGPFEIKSPLVGSRTASFMLDLANYSIGNSKDLYIYDGPIHKSCTGTISYCSFKSELLIQKGLNRNDSIHFNTDKNITSRFDSDEKTFIWGEEWYKILSTDNLQDS